MVTNYNPCLVALSIVVAIFASYVTLDLAARVAAAQGKRAAQYWLAGGALSMGVGIWSMHFVGMLALRLPIPMSYDISITLLSLVIAIGASAFALSLMNAATLNMRRLLSSGVLLGIAIASMHYTGMEAMQMSPPIRYDLLLFSLSILIAIAASIAALWIAFRLRTETVRPAFWKKSGSALVMGAAISGMHYTGMAAAIFAPDSICTVTSQNINNLWLASGIGGGSFMFLATTLLVSVFDAHLASYLVMHAETVHRMNVQRAEERLRASEEKLASVLESIDNVVWSVSATTHEMLYVSPTAEKLYGRPVTHFREYKDLWSDFIHPEDRAQAVETFSSLLHKGAFTLECRITGPDGKLLWIETRARVTRDSEGTAVRFDGVSSDITKRKAHEARIEYLANHDQLTDLPSRNLLDDRIAQSISQARRTGLRLAIVCLDLDRFKFINDSLGHPIGDALLKAVASRLTESVRESDTVARLGGDEFVLMLLGVQHPDEASVVAKKVLAGFSRPFHVEGHELHVGASMGVSVYPEDGERGDTLLKNADAAMYRAKEQGRNGVQFYTREMGSQMQERMELEGALRLALERREFELHYQPKVDLRSGRIHGVEALLRWHRADFGLVAPDRFIPVAEETGMIGPIGEWVLRTACVQTKKWHDAGHSELSIAVNLSARQFRQKSIPALVRRILKETKLPARYLELELTESVLMQDTEAMIFELRELKEIGVVLSLDDFGTGYSSLSYLKRFPVDVVKIDRSFIRDVTTDLDDATLAKTILAMTQSLDLKTVAEGVETEDQLRFLRDNGCDAIQGYYFSRPVPANDMTALLLEDRRISVVAFERVLLQP